MNATRREEIFRRWRRANPDPQTELAFNNRFELLIAIILSAQATDIAVNKVTPDLFAFAGTPTELAQADLESIRKRIKTIGLFNAKAKNIKTCAELLVSRHDSVIPQTRDELEALPGVGAKTAGVFMNVALGLPEIPVDTHVFRVANRTGVAKAENEKKTEARLKRLVPRWAQGKAHHWMILHGRYTCLARKPRCGVCNVADLCDYKEKTL